MTVQREIRVAVAVLLLFQLATSFTGIVLLSRMSPSMEMLAEPGACIRAAEEITNLGTAGAWAAVAFGLLAFLFFIFYGRRLNTQVIDPLQEIERVVDAAERGDTFRRCVLHGPDDIRTIASGLNHLLDAREQHDPAVDRTAANDRAALLHLLDRSAQPTLVIDGEGTILASNRAGTKWLGDRPQERVADYRRANTGAAERIGDDDLWLLEVGEPAPG